MKNYLIITFFLLYSLHSLAYEDGIRIAWDYNQQVFHNAGVYARIKKLRNGDLALVYSYGVDVYIKKTTVGSSIWSDPVLVSSDSLSFYNYTNAELIELDNGTLIYTWNARPKTARTQPYKIMIKFSNDAGRTWHSEQDVYTAGNISEDGCWEPVFLQLPSGEIQLYFANEHNVESRYQNITMLRSFNNGQTWQTPETVAYRHGFRDGMPVPVYLQDDKGIVFAIEDNGINGPFKPVIIHTDINDNWKSGTITGTSSKRWHALRSDYQLASEIYAGAPYLIQLDTKETILSIQSAEGRQNTHTHTNSIMQVYIGDEEAKNFSRKSTPFPNIPSAGNALWNALCQTSDSTIAAISSLSRLAEKNGVWSVTGKIIKPMESCKIEANKEKWNEKDNVFIGSESQASLRVKSMWDNDNLYFYFDVKDKILTIADETAALWDTDGVEVYLDMRNTNSDAIVSGQYKLLVNIAEKTLFNRSSGSDWVNWNPQVRYTITKNQTGYTIEISIPWNETGGKPSAPFGVHFKLNNNDGNMESIVHENLSGGHPDSSNTWLKCSLVEM